MQRFWHLGLLFSLSLFSALACQGGKGDEDKASSEASEHSEEVLLDAADGAAALRALSFALRDLPPERETAKALARAEVSLSSLREEWLQSPEHLERVGRFFHDAFGTKRWPEATFGARALVQDESGWWQSSDNFPQCTSSADLEMLEAWWGQRGETQAVCKLADCGPYALRCSLVSHRPRLMDAIRFEFRDRGLYVYQNNLSWDDLYFKPFIFGNRLLAHKYLLDSELFTKETHALKASADQLRRLVDFLFDLSLEEAEVLELPSLGPERSGLLTSPGFMQRFNNFRSRVRALSEGLLCQDIGPWMNPTGLSTFVNQTSLSSFDLEHGSKASCASCHLGLDNWGSTLLGWSDNGSWQWWKTWSQSGAVFGSLGEGPGFLMQSILKQKDPFMGCMALKVWEGFSQGKSWDELSQSEKEALLQAAEEGPRALLHAVFRGSALIMTR